MPSKLFRVATCVLRGLWRGIRAAGEFLYLLYRDFDDMRCATRASALSYATVLAIVPLLAVTISISRNFLRDASQDLVPRLLDRLIFSAIPLLDYVPPGSLGDSLAAPSAAETARIRSHAARERVIREVTAFVENINYDALGAVGMLALLFVGVRLIESVENSVNDIWGVTKGRGRIQRLVYYWTALTLGPLVVLLGLGASASWGIERLVSHPALRILPKASSNLVVLWVFFSLLYMVLPNTRVKLGAALSGGVVGGSLWRANSLLSAMYFRRAVAYTTIYGSLGLVMVVLVGIYLTWLIFLLGVVVSYRAQHMGEYHQEMTLRRVNQASIEFLAVAVMLQVARRFLTNGGLATTESMARELGVPERVVGEAVRRLVQAELLVALGPSQEGIGYQLGKDPHTLTPADVLEAIRAAGGEWLEHKDTEHMARLRSVFERMSRGAREAVEGQTLAALVEGGTSARGTP